MSTSGFLTRLASSAATRAISPWPGRKARIDPLSSASASQRRAHDLRPRCAHRGIAAEIARLDREGAPLALDQRGLAHQLRHPRAVERRRHHQEAQVLAQGPLRVERQRQAEIGVERALVEFVEQHRRDAFERRVVEDHAREHAFGDDLDARARRDEALQAHPEPDRLADLLAEARRHARRGGARGETARLQHDDLAGPARRARPAAPAERASSCRRRAARRGSRWVPAFSAARSRGRASSIGKLSGKASIGA